MNKERVLIVDDEKNIVASLQDILADEGYEVGSSMDGLDALEKIQNDPPDLVLLDIWIPGMDGIEVLKTIKTYYPEMAVLIMSGHGTIETAVKATKLGAYNFIEKPFSLDQITKSIASALRDRQTESREKSWNNEIPFCFDRMVEIKKSIKSMARHIKPTLILGESGVGKELIAQSIHRQSKIRELPLIKLNCAVRPMPNIQSQLFKSSPRSSTKKELGAPDRKIVYLTNIEALGKSLQEKLAKALKAQEEDPKGNDAGFLAARLIAASSVNLAELAQKGDFHPGLYGILEKGSLAIPPLREYSDRIPNLIQTYFEEFLEGDGAKAPQFDPDALKTLCAYSWPGNIKELRGLLEQIVIPGTNRQTISLNDLPAKFRIACVETPDVRASTSSNGGDSRGSTEKKTAPPLRQRTLKRSVVLCGSGLHSGINTGLILQPLPPGSGIIFGDISSRHTIPARLENVQSTDYSTCLGKGPSSVATIEHIMAVLHMYRITNLLIKIGDEAPVMDGSAKDFCQLIEDGEFEIQDEEQEEMVIRQKYSFGSKENGGAYISIEPADNFIVEYHMEYPEPIGVCDYTYEFSGAESFKTAIAPARTFGFMEEVAQLNAMGFGVGGKLDNFILLGDGKVLNTELRYDNEFVRHKILDIIGDLYLLGKPIRGRVRAHKSGHTQNIGLLKNILTSLS